MWNLRFFQFSWHPWHPWGRLSSGDIWFELEKSSNSQCGQDNVVTQRNVWLPWIIDLTRSGVSTFLKCRKKSIVYFILLLNYLSLTTIDRENIKFLIGFMFFLSSKHEIFWWNYALTQHWLKYGFCNKSFRKDETLTSWTLLQLICPHFWAGLLLYSAITPKSEDKYVVKVFNSSEFHLSEMTLFQNPYFSRIVSISGPKHISWFFVL